MTGTPQGGILSPLLANIALSVLDEHFVAAWAAMGAHSGARQQWRRRGLATYRLVRYADDFVVLVAGTRAHAEALRAEVAAVLAPMAYACRPRRRGSPTSTRASTSWAFASCGSPSGTGQRFVYTYPTKTALATVKAKVRALTRGATDLSLSILLYRLNPVLRGWTAYFRHGVSKATFNYLRAFVWRRVVCWLRHEHLGTNWRQLRRHSLPGWWPTEGEVTLFNPSGVTVSRYCFRGMNIPSPWAERTSGSTARATA